MKSLKEKKFIAAGPISLFACKVEKKISGKKFSQLLWLASDSERKRAERFKRERDAAIYLTGRALVRKILSALANVDAKQLVIEVDGRGRPFLKHPRIRHLDFNLSHSGEWVILASGFGRMGIDIERIGPVDQKIFKDIFSYEELAYLDAPGRLGLKRFYELWTLKEAFLKALGSGLSYPLKKASFNFSREGDRIKMTRREKEKKWYFKIYDLDRDYLVAFCSERKKFPARIQMFSMNLLHYEK